MHALVWTDQKPTEPGWYCRRLAVYAAREIVEVVQEGKTLIAYKAGEQTRYPVVSFVAGQWAGPIPDPVEANHA